MTEPQGPWTSRLCRGADGVKPHLAVSDLELQVHASDQVLRPPCDRDATATTDVQ